MSDTPDGIGNIGDDGDEQDRSEALDGDELPGDADDPDTSYPLEQLLGADQYGLSAAEEEIDEPLEERVAREDPDPLAVELDEEERELEADEDGTSLGAALRAIDDELAAGDPEA